MAIEQDENLILCIDQSWSDDHGLGIKGWILGKDKTVLDEVVVCVGDTCVPITSWHPRPDVATAFPEYYNEKCGFVIQVNQADNPHIILEAKSQGKIFRKTITVNSRRTPKSEIIDEYRDIPEQYLKLDLGCGGNKKIGTLGLDYIKQPGVDYVIDLQKGTLPFPNRSVDYVYSAHCLEHLTQPAPIPLFQEISRVCIDGSQVEFWTPYLWDNSAFIFGHTNYYSEDQYLHLCVWFPHIWEKSLGARWLLKEIVYVVEPAVLIELYNNKVQIDFALRHYKGIAKEFGVFIEVRHNYTRETIYPRQSFATDRYAQRHLLTSYPDRIDESELRQAINFFLHPKAG